MCLYDISRQTIQQLLNCCVQWAVLPVWLQAGQAKSEKPTTTSLKKKQKVIVAERTRSPERPQEQQAWESVYMILIGDCDQNCLYMVNWLQSGITRHVCIDIIHPHPLTLTLLKSQAQRFDNVHQPTDKIIFELWNSLDFCRLLLPLAVMLSAGLVPQNSI